MANKRKYVTSKLTVGDVITKDSVVFYVVGEGIANHKKEEGDVLVNTYQLMSARKIKDPLEQTSISLDDRGWVVVAMLTEEGVNVARNNPSALDYDKHYADPLEEHLIYSSKLGSMVAKIEQIAEDPMDETIQAVLSIVLV